MTVLTSSRLDRERRFSFDLCFAKLVLLECFIASMSSRSSRIFSTLYFVYEFVLAGTVLCKGYLLPSFVLEVSNPRSVSRDSTFGWFAHVSAGPARTVNQYLVRFYRAEKTIHTEVRRHKNKRESLICRDGGLWQELLIYMKSSISYPKYDSERL